MKYWIIKFSPTLLIVCEKHPILTKLRYRTLSVFIAIPLEDARSLMAAKRLLAPILYSVDQVCVSFRATSSPFRLLDNNCTLIRRCSILHSQVTKRHTIARASPIRLVPSNITETFCSETSLCILLFSCFNTTGIKSALPISKMIPSFFKQFSEML